MVEKSKPKLRAIRPREGDEPILVEVMEVDEGGKVTQAGPKVTNFEEMLEKIKPFCESVVKNFKELSIRPDSASAEFGLKVSAKGNLFIVEASGEATIKVILNWSLKEGAKASTNSGH